MKKRVAHLRPPNCQQRGSALIVSMVMLLLLTILGITTMNTVTIEERMAGNMVDYNLAFQSAEAGLRDGEDWIRPLTTEPTPCDSAPCDIWEGDILTDLATQPASWWAANGREYGEAGNTEIGRSMDPFYLMEFQSFVKDDLLVGHTPPTGRAFYRVTASSTGGSETAQSTLQSSFVKRFN